MQNPGSLRKRRSRNLSKVTGLGLLSTIVHDNENIVNFNRQNSSGIQAVDFFTLSTSLQPNHSLNLNAVNKSKTRPYLLSNDAIWRLEKILTLGRLVFYFPWSWGEKKTPNKVTNFVIRRWNRTWERIWMIFNLLPLFCSSVLVFYHFYNLLESVRGSPTTYRLPFKHYEAICWHLHSAMLNCLLLRYKESMRIYVNTLFAFNSKLVVEYGLDMTSLKKRGQLFMNGTVPIFFFQIFVSVLRYCLNYNAPGYLTHYWSEGNNGTPFWFIVLGAVQDFLTGGQLVSGTLFLGWCTVAHAISLEFWIEEAHCNNDSEMTRDKLRDGKTSLEIYRMSQILANLFNHSVGKVSVPMCAYMNWSAAIACGYLTIRSMNQLFIDELPASVFFPCGLILTMCSAFAQFQMSAMMHDMSGSFLDSWSYTRDDAVRRFLASCPLLRTTAGGFPSVTRNSLVGYFQTVSNHIIDCAITFT